MLLFILGLTISFVLFEIILRVFEPKKYELSECTSLDQEFHHVMIPNKECRFKTDEWDVIYKINAEGLREDEIRAKKENVYRVLVLGDSFTQGHGVSQENSFVDLVEKKFRESGRNVEFINAGVYGYSPILEYLFLLKKGIVMQPDLVIQVFSVTDFYEDRLRFQELLKDYPNLPEENIFQKIQAGDMKFLFGNVSGNTVNTHISPLKKLSFQAKSLLKNNLKSYSLINDLIKKNEQPVQQDVLHQGDIDRDIVAILRGEKITDQNWEELWRLPLYHLTLMKNLLVQNNIAFVVVAIPEAVQVGNREWPNRKALGLEENFHDPRGPFQDELSKRLAQFDIPVINLLAGFRESGIYPLYFSRDGHFRESGHYLAAEIIFKSVLSLDLLNFAM